MPLSPLYTDDTSDVIMEDRIKILGVEMDCLTAKEAMLEAMRFMENDSVDTIEILSILIHAFGIVKLKETENRTFLKIFMKYLQKNQKKVFVLAETEEELTRVEEAIQRYNRGIRFTGDALLGPDDNREESVINYINGTETDCILSVLPSPYQRRRSCEKVR